jgi:anaerobic ribonucleoside-triphosphate reductase activating protein
MNIAATQYSAEQKCLEIYVAGCVAPHCLGCHNPELWDFNVGERYSEEFTKSLETKIKEFDRVIDNIWILGGEPLDQNTGSLQHLLEVLRKTGKAVWLFTRYSIDDVTMAIKSQCYYIKCGKYDQNNLTEDNIQYGVKLSSSNQHIYKIGE